MIHMLVHFAVLTVTVLLLARFLPGVRITRTRSAAMVALVFGGLNLLVGWLVKALLAAVLFLPAILTLGLAWLLVPFIANIILLWITDKLLDAFELRDTRALLIAAGAITLVNGLLHFQNHVR
jgi:putative membrane protein